MRGAKRLGQADLCVWRTGQVPCAESEERDDFISSPCGGRRGHVNISTFFLFFFSVRGPTGWVCISYFSFFFMWGQVGAHKKASVRTLASGSNVRVLAVPCFHFHDFITVSTPIWITGKLLLLAILA